MSNTAEVTPYQDDSTGQAGAALEACAAAVAELIEAFSQTDAEREIANRYRELQRKDRLSVARINLGCSDAAGLLSAARQTGFTPIRPLQVGAIAAPIELRNKAGDRLAILVRGGGAMLVSSAGRKSMQTIVRRHTLDRARLYLEALSGGMITIRELGGGVVELRAPEKAKEDTATITAQVMGDGSTRVDIENVRGTRCEKLVNEFSQAVGGRVVAKSIKPDYYEVSRPGEPTRVSASR